MKAIPGERQKAPDYERRRLLAAMVAKHAESAAMAYALRRLRPEASVVFRTHASRLLARYSSRGCQLQVIEPPKFPEHLPTLVEVAGLLAPRYREMAQTCRELRDLSSAWVCELNAAECFIFMEEARQLCTMRG